MSDTLTNAEVEVLTKLGNEIKTGLACDINHHRLPCLNDRLSSVDAMRRYLEIHDYEVRDPRECYWSMTDKNKYRIPINEYLASRCRTIKKYYLERDNTDNSICEDMLRIEAENLRMIEDAGEVYILEKSAIERIPGKIDIDIYA